MNHEILNEMYMIINIKTQLGRWQALNEIAKKWEEEQ